MRSKAVKKSPELHRVLLNIVRLLPEGKGAGGAGRLVMALLTHLPKYVDLRVAIAPHSEYLLERFPDLNFIVVSNDTNANLNKHLRWCQCYIDPLNGLRPTHIDAGVAVISMVLDLQHMRMPWLFSASEMASRLAEYSYAIARSDHLVAISDYERENLLEYYDVDRVTVMHLAGFMAEDSKAPKPKPGKNLPADGGYLIYPAVPWLHKNHEILIQAIGILNRRGVKIPLVLTNTGGRTQMRKHLSNVARAHDAETLVSLKEYLPEDELFSLFAGSTGMVFPTLYEGFGIPLVDAMALGVPVLTTRTSAVPEICGDAAAYFSNPMNAVAMADDLEKFWTSPQARAATRKKALVQATNFSSEKMALCLLEAIRAAIARKGASDNNLPQQSRVIPARFLPLSVLIVYSDLSKDDQEWLSKMPDLHAWHIEKFGHDADITVAMDTQTASNPKLRKALASLPKLILCGGTDAGSIDHAVLDFSNRYDHSLLQLAVRFSEDRLSRYTPDRITLATLALGLHQDADYAIFNENVADCILDGEPPELDGVLNYDTRCRSGSSVFDAIAKRAASGESRNGSSQYLSKFCTKLRRLHVPCA